ncbi:MAG TPA: FIST N-terminal domain-containing protein [Polyangiaceae bacterium]
MRRDVATAATEMARDSEAVADLARQLGGVDASAVLTFFDHRRDGAAIVGGLRDHFPLAEVIGCTTVGEFTERSYGTGGAVAVALSRHKVSRAASALASYEGGVVEGVRAAAERIGEKLGEDLRQCDPERYVGIVLLEAMKGKEEEANDALGRVAPFLSFVGGSAGDGLRFAETRVYAEGRESTDGAALLVLRMESPFSIVKTCSFTQREGASFRVTKADPARRIVYELDGKPIVAAYSAALGIPGDRLDGGVFSSHPLGLMIEGSPWIRTPQQVLPDGGIRFACQLVEGMRIDIMNTTDLIEDTGRAFAQAERAIGGRASGAVLFNCAYRRVDIEQKGLTGAFRQLLTFPTAGFHTYGESWLGHMNHTLVGLLIA